MMRGELNRFFIIKQLKNFFLFACALFCSKILIRRRLVCFIFITEHSTGKASPFVKSDHM